MSQLIPPAARCRECDRALEANAADGLCPRCRHARLRRAATERRETERIAASSAALARWKARRARGSSNAAATPVIAIVPANTRALVPLPERRRNAFRAHLRDIIDEAQRRRVFTFGRAAAPAELAPDAPSAGLAAACAACRGHCCGGGGDHAYLDVDAVRRYVARSGRTSPAAVLRAFLRRLPAASYADSCVYHTGAGCALPRAMRAAVCNAFYCQAVQDQRALLDEAPPGPLLIGAADGTRLVRLVPIAGVGPPSRRE